MCRWVHHHRRLRVWSYSFCNNYEPQSEYWTAILTFIDFWWQRPYPSQYSSSSNTSQLGLECYLRSDHQLWLQNNWCIFGWGWTASYRWIYFRRRCCGWGRWHRWKAHAHSRWYYTFPHSFGTISRLIYSSLFEDWSCFPHQSRDSRCCWGRGSTAWYISHTNHRNLL